MATPSKLVHVIYMTRRYEQLPSWYKTVFGSTSAIMSILPSVYVEDCGTGQTKLVASYRILG